MAPYLMNHYLRKYLIKIWCVLFYRRYHTFDVKTFVFCVSLNFARDISTVFEEIKHLRSRAPDNILPDY